MSASAATKAAVVKTAASAAEVADDGGSMDVDADETRYCICNEVAFGAMVACDNKNVKSPIYFNFLYYLKNFLYFTYLSY